MAVREAPAKRRFTDDATGAIADLGIMVPLAATLISVNGLEASAVFVAAGALVIGAGVWFKIPFPVQPLKALTAVAVARGLAPGVIHAAGLEIAAFLLLLTIGGLADRIAKVFTKRVVRALQFGVGSLLVLTAVRMVRKPPEVFTATFRPPWPIVLGVIAFAIVWWAARTQRYVAALLVLMAGLGITIAAAAPSLTAPALTLPSVGLPSAADFAPAFVLLVLPQIPLTFGNAVVAVTDVAKDAFGERAARVTPARVCVSCGIGNVASALLGGSPVCHGAGGLTAHVRLGARTMWMNVGLGTAFLVGGLFFAEDVPALLGLLPAWALAAFLAWAGVRHALLIGDLRGADLAVAVGGGLVGAATGNLAFTLAIGLAYHAVRRLMSHRRTSAVA